MTACLEDVKAWMSLIFFCLNESKTEVVVFTSSSIHNTTNVDLGVLAPYVKPYVKNLGVVLDSALKKSFMVLSLQGWTSVTRCIWGSVNHTLAAFKWSKMLLPEFGQELGNGNV